MRPLSGCLSILIATAEDMMRRPCDLPARLPDTFGELAQEIRDHDRRPSEGKRCTFAAMSMLPLIEGFSGDGHYHWQMAIGALLPLVKQDAWQAMANEKAVREARD